MNVFFPEAQKQTLLFSFRGDTTVGASLALVVAPVETAAPASHHKAKDSGEMLVYLVTF